MGVIGRQATTGGGRSGRNRYSNHKVNVEAGETYTPSTNEELDQVFWDGEGNTVDVDMPIGVMRVDNRALVTQIVLTSPASATRQTFSATFPPGTILAAGVEYALVSGSPPDSQPAAFFIYESGGAEESTGDSSDTIPDPVPFSASIPGGQVNHLWVTTKVIASGPTLDTIPATAYPGESITVAVTGAGATQGTGGVTIGGVAQTITSWSDTSITFTTVLGSNSYGTGKAVELTTDSGGTATGTIELIVEPGTGGYVDVVGPNTTDTSAFAYQAETAGGDPVATGDQFEWRYTGVPGDVTDMTVQADTLASYVDQEGDVDGRFWDATDSTWGAWGTFTAEVPSTDWPYGKGIRYAAAQNWTWGRRHPKTNMRVRVYK